VLCLAACQSNAFFAGRSNFAIRNMQQTIVTIKAAMKGDAQCALQAIQAVFTDSYVAAETTSQSDMITKIG
jgi:hypothetical protein